MCTVYKITTDPDTYQELLANDLDAIDFNVVHGESVAETWTAPTVYIPHPKKRVPDFWGCFSGACFAVTDETYRKFGPALEQSCEFLPLIVEDGPELLICNITYVINCLDKSQSVLQLKAPDFREKFVFHSSRLGYTLFKIPERRSVDMFCVEGVIDPRASAH